jgi:hypothetical protein
MRQIRDDKDAGTLEGLGCRSAVAVAPAVRSIIDIFMVRKSLNLLLLARSWAAASSFPGGPSAMQHIEIRQEC